MSSLMVLKLKASDIPAGSGFRSMSSLMVLKQWATSYTKSECFRSMSSLMVLKQKKAISCIKKVLDLCHHYLN